MRKRLSKGALLLIVLILVVLAGNQVIIGLFSSFSEKLILENHELNALHELKGALGKILIYDNQFLANHEEDIRESVDNANHKFKECERVISMAHKGDTWETVEFMFRTMKNNVNNLMESPPGEGVLQHIISHQIFDLISQVDLLIMETLEEINEYETKSQKVKLHGTITVIVVGIMLILTLALGSLRFIKGLTRPIEQLLDGIRKIGEGDRNTRLQVDSGDEFMLLADSFNSMLEALNKTSISEKNLSNILNNLYGALLVTDSTGRIRSINATTMRMLNYKETDLIGKKIGMLFKGSKLSINSESMEEPELFKLANEITKETEMLDKDGHAIPVYVTSVVMKTGEGSPEGMVVVGHDLTEEKEKEAKIEKLRKERMIAIHEAQELERLRLSRDLHDGLGQLLTGISYSVQKLSEEKTIDKEFASRLEDQVNTAIQETRNIAQNLTPIVLRDFGLVAAIENLVQRTNQLNKTRFLFNSYSFTERIDEKLEKAIFRICQESINNIIKHAGAKESTLELYRVEDMIVLVIEDDGQGFDTGILNQKEDEGGLGLISMQERVNAFDGDIVINSKKGTGTEIVVEIPCRKKKKNGNS
jgi:PAS domain S-box-containing protein